MAFVINSVCDFALSSKERNFAHASVCQVQPQTLPHRELLHRVRLHDAERGIPAPRVRKTWEIQTETQRSSKCSLILHKHTVNCSNRADEQQRRHSFHSSSPRKRLQFMSADRGDGKYVKVFACCSSCAVESMLYCFSGPAAAAHLCSARRGKLPAGLGGAGSLPWFTCASAGQAALAGRGWETVRRAHTGENAGGRRSVWAKVHHTSRL